MGIYEEKLMLLREVLPEEIAILGEKNNVEESLLALEQILGIDLDLENWQKEAIKEIMKEGGIK